MFPNTVITVMMLVLSVPKTEVSQYSIMPGFTLEGGSQSDVVTIPTWFMYVTLIGLLHVNWDYKSYTNITVATTIFMHKLLFKIKYMSFGSLCNTFTLIVTHKLQLVTRN